MAMEKHDLACDDFVQTEHDRTFNDPIIQEVEQRTHDYFMLESGEERIMNLPILNDSSNNSPNNSP